MKKLWICLLLCPLFVVTAYAEGAVTEDAALREFYAVEEALPEAEREISGSLRLDGSYDAQGALARLWERWREQMAAQLRAELHFGVQLFSIALLCSLSAALLGKKELEDVMNLAGCCTVSLLLAGDLDGLVAQASQTLVQLSDYSRAAMPALFTAAAACGAPAGAAARYAAASLAIDVIIGTAKQLILPLIHSFIALAVCRSIFENAALNALLKLVKWCATTAMTVLTMAFSAYLTITGLITASTDALAVKTAKTVISRALPVVGGILADSAGIVLAAASVIKNSAGVFSLIAVCALCLGPFVVLSVKMLVYKAAAAASELLPGGRLSRLIGDIGTAYGMLLGMIGSCGIMLFISIMSGIRVVSG